MSTKSQPVKRGKLGWGLFGITLAVLCLITANVRAELITATALHSFEEELFSFTVTRSGGANATFSNFSQSDEVVVNWNNVGNFSFSSGYTITGFSIKRDGNEGWGNLATMATALIGNDGDLTFSAPAANRRNPVYFDFTSPFSSEELGFSFNMSVSANGTYTFVFYGRGLEETPTSTPEPATLAVLGLGLAGLGLVRRRMKK